VRGGDARSKSGGGGRESGEEGELHRIVLRALWEGVVLAVELREESRTSAVELNC
jgi:hypothetical protein